MVYQETKQKNEFIILSIIHSLTTHNFNWCYDKNNLFVIII